MCDKIGIGLVQELKQNLLQLYDNVSKHLHKKSLSK